MLTSFSTPRKFLTISEMFTLLGVDFLALSLRPPQDWSTGVPGWNLDDLMVDDLIEISVFDLSLELL